MKCVRNHFITQKSQLTFFPKPTLRYAAFLGLRAERYEDKNMQQRRLGYPQHNKVQY